MRSCSCPNCNASLNIIDDNREFAICEYCGSKIMFDDIRITHRIINEPHQKDAEIDTKIRVLELEIKNKELELELMERKQKNETETAAEKTEKPEVQQEEKEEVTEIVEEVVQQEKPAHHQKYSSAQKKNLLILLAIIAVFLIICKWDAVYGKTLYHIML